MLFDLRSLTISEIIFGIMKSICSSVVLRSRLILTKRSLQIAQNNLLQENFEEYGTFRRIRKKILRIVISVRISIL